MKTIAFVNNRIGAGQTTLVYHLGHMLAALGQRVLMFDLDPQSELTARCLDEETLEALEALGPAAADGNDQALGWVSATSRGGEGRAQPSVWSVGGGPGLVSGGPTLSRSEEQLAASWTRALDGDAHALSALGAFARLVDLSAKQQGASVGLMDLGPGLGAINRAALLAADFVVTPLAPDLYTAQALRNLGPTLRDWRVGWQDRLSRGPPGLELPSGAMAPLGYIITQSGMRLSRPVRAYPRWLGRMPSEYHRALLGDELTPPGTDEDPWCLGLTRHYPGLMPLALDAQKPMFSLKPGDGAIGAHMDAVQRCREDFARLAQRLLDRTQELSRSG